MEGMTFNGVLPVLKGTGIHDCMSTYRRFGMSHGTCNANIPGELREAEETEPGRMWPRLFRLLPISMKSKEDAQASESDTMPIETPVGFDERYDRIPRLADGGCPSSRRASGGGAGRWRP